MKRLARAILRWVFGGAGRLCALFAAPVDATVVCVFATPNIGGAERVHAEIVRAIGDARPQVWFTERGGDQGLLGRYEAHARVVQLGRRLQCRLCAYFQAGLQAGRIRRGGVKTVFGAFSHFFYDMLPWLKGVRCVDLLHNFGVAFEHYSLPHVARLARRVVITQSLLRQVQDLYDAHGVPSNLAARVLVIGNAVPVPPDQPAKPPGPVRVLYAGRATPEKRVHLVGQVASRLRTQGVNADVRLVGDVGAAIAAQDAPHCDLTGLVTDPVAMRAEYRAAHVLVLASEREGFPLAVMEAMAQGAVPVCTRVGGLGELPGDCCILVDAQPEAAAVAGIVEAIKGLADDPAKWGAMSTAAWAHARQHFSQPEADRAWRALLLEAQP